MSIRVAWSLILASLAFGFVLGWVVSGGRQRLDRPSPGQLSQQMAPGMARTQEPRTSPAPALPPDHPPIDENWTEQPGWQNEVQKYRNRVDRDPLDWQAWLALGRLYAMAKQSDQAEEAYRQLLQLRKDNPQLIAEVGFFYLNIGRFEDAEKLADEALALDPNQADALFLKGTVLGMYRKDPKRAIQVWEQLLEKHPNYQMAPLVRDLLDKMKQRTGLPSS